MRHLEGHQAGRIGWLRAAVLGANDGIVSTASLIAGVAAAGAAICRVLGRTPGAKAAQALAARDAVVT